MRFAVVSSISLLVVVMFTAGVLAEAPVAQPNMVVGRVLGQSQEPIAIEGVAYSVAISGMTSAGERVT